MDAKQAAAIERTLGTLQGDISGLQKFAATHAEEDRETFSEFHSKLNTISDRLSAIPAIQATVAKHEVQLAEIEDTMNRQEVKDAEAEAIARTNMKWIKVGAILAFTVAARVYAPDLVQLVQGNLFK